MFISLTDQKENRFVVSVDHIVGWQYLETMGATNLILSIHKVGECVSVKETPEQILKLIKKGE